MLSRIEDKIVILKVDEYREKELSQEIEKLIIKEMLDKFINIGIGEYVHYYARKNNYN